MLANSLWTLPIFDGFTVSELHKRLHIKREVERVLLLSDWTQLPDSGLTLSDQLHQQELRAAWMALDDPNIDPDMVTLPPYPLMERP